MEEWERCVNSLRVDEDFRFDIYITGSNAKLLSGELSTYLAGRYIEFFVYPFSFKEFFEIIQVKNQEIKVKEAFQNYVKFQERCNLFHFPDLLLQILPFH